MKVGSYENGINKYEKQNLTCCLRIKFWVHASFRFTVVEFPSLDHVVSSTPLETQAEAAYGVILRLVPDHAAKFSVNVDPSIGPKYKDTFKVYA